MLFHKPDSLHDETLYQHAHQIPFVNETLLILPDYPTNDHTTKTLRPFNLDTTDASLEHAAMKAGADTQRAAQPDLVHDGADRQIKEMGKGICIMITNAFVRSKLGASQKLFEALDDDGDALGEIHVVEHHFIADQSDKLTQLLEMGTHLGFGSTKIETDDDPKTGRYHYCDVLSHVPILCEDYDVYVAPAREVLIMLCMAESFDCKYDGWGTKKIAKQGAQPVSACDSSPREDTGRGPQEK